MRKLEYEALALKWQEGLATPGELDDMAKYLRRELRHLTTRMETNEVMFRGRAIRTAARAMLPELPKLIEAAQFYAEVMPPKFSDDFTGISDRLESLRNRLIKD